MPPYGRPHSTRSPRRWPRYKTSRDLCRSNQSGCCCDSRGPRTRLDSSRSTSAVRPVRPARVRTSPFPCCAFADARQRRRPRSCAVVATLALFATGAAVLSRTAATLAYVQLYDALGPSDDAQHDRCTAARCPLRAKCSRPPRFATALRDRTHPRLSRSPLGRCAASRSKLSRRRVAASTRFLPTSFDPCSYPLRMSFLDVAITASRSRRMRSPLRVADPCHAEASAFCPPGPEQARSMRRFPEPVWRYTVRPLLPRPLLDLPRGAGDDRPRDRRTDLRISIGVPLVARRALQLRRHHLLRRGDRPCSPSDPPNFESSRSALVPPAAHARSLPRARRRFVPFVPTC